MGLIKNLIIAIIPSFLIALLLNFILSMFAPFFNYSISPDFTNGFVAGFIAFAILLSLIWNWLSDDELPSEAFSIFSSDKGVLESQHAYKKRKLDPIKYKDFDDE